MRKPASIGILEDDDVLRHYLATIIESADGFEVAFTSARISDALEASNKRWVDACLVDLDLPDGSGIEFTKELKSRGSAKILILTVLADRKSVLTALKAGADGYLLKDSQPYDIVASLESVLAGETPISPQAAKFLLKTFTEVSNAVSMDRSSRLEALTERERDTLVMFERGLSYKETAEALGVSHNTVRTHVKSIYSKLNVSSRNEALFEARQEGLLSSD